MDFNKQENKLKRVLVTGSSKGIGRAIALYLAKQGYKITLHCKSDMQSAQNTANEISEIGEKPEIIQFDISNRSLAREVLQTAVEKHGAYFGVVLSAGSYKDAPFPGLSEEDWDSVLHSNLDGFYNVLHPLVMPMIQLRNGGRIVVLSSISGITGNRGQVNYSASKAGLIGASKALSKELAKRRISVNCVAPGIIESDMTKDLNTDEFIKNIPMQRLGKPEEVAAVVAFLFSDHAEYITSQVISVNGGMI